MKQTDKLSQWVGAVVVIFGVLVALYMEAYGAGWRVGYKSADNCSSIGLTVYKNGTSWFTSTRNNVWEFDTVIAIADSADTFYQAVFDINRVDADSNATAFYQAGGGTTGLYKVLAKWEGETDSVRLILDTNGTTYGSHKFIRQSHDTTLAIHASKLQTARYNIWYTGETYPVLWTWGKDNRLTKAGGGIGGACPVAVPASNCAVTVFVVDNAGNPAPGVMVAAYLTGHSLADSLGQAIENTPQYVPTDANGNATFICIWSSYIIPATKWRFTVLSSGNKKKDYTVPRQEYDTVSMGA